MNSFGIIGNGFVGNAIFQGMKNAYEIIVYDVCKEKSPDTFKDVNQQDVVFVCVPTPMHLDGMIDISILKHSISDLSGGKILIIKSTITPIAAQEIVEEYDQHRFVFNPEFLTERTAVEDFKNPSRIVLGGDASATNKVQQMYKKIFPNTKYIKTDYKTACYIKYFCNCFYASKISLMNEFKQIADASGANWEIALEGLLSSGWVNDMHTQVPGPDGQLGFGGKCFPKDINAFIKYSESLGIDPKVMKAAWEKNLEVRKDLDWYHIEGAVTKNKEKK